MSANGSHPNDDPNWQLTHHLDDETLSAYLDHALAAPVRSSVAAHLAGCAACRRTLAELRAVVTLLGDLPAPAPPRSFALTPAMAAARQPRIIRLLPHLRALTAVAAVVLLISFTPDLLSRAGSSAAGPTLLAPMDVNRSPATDAQAPAASGASQPTTAATPPQPPPPAGRGEAATVPPAPAAAQRVPTTAPAARRAETPAPAAKPVAPAAAPKPAADQIAPAAAQAVPATMLPLPTPTLAPTPTAPATTTAVVTPGAGVAAPRTAESPPPAALTVAPRLAAPSRPAAGAEGSEPAAEAGALAGGWGWWRALQVALALAVFTLLLIILLAPRLTRSSR